MVDVPCDCTAALDAIPHGLILTHGLLLHIRITISIPSSQGIKLLARSRYGSIQLGPLHPKRFGRGCARSHASCPAQRPVHTGAVQAVTPGPSVMLDAVLTLR